MYSCFQHFGANTKVDDNFKIIFDETRIVLATRDSKTYELAARVPYITHASANVKTIKFFSDGQFAEATLNGTGKCNILPEDNNLWKVVQDLYDSTNQISLGEIKKLNEDLIQSQTAPQAE